MAFICFYQHSSVGSGHFDLYSWLITVVSASLDVKTRKIGVWEKSGIKSKQWNLTRLEQCGLAFGAHFEHSQMNYEIDISPYFEKKMIRLKSSAHFHKSREAKSMRFNW